MVQRLKEYIEQTINLKEEAEKANKAKTDFLSRMSHELRTPLNAVLGYGQLLELDDLSKDQKDSVEQILFGGRHLLGLVEDILDMTKVREGILKLVPEPVNIYETVKESWSLAGYQADEKNVEFNIIDTPDVHSYFVFADPQRVKQVIINLLVNSIKYNYKNGRIDVSFEPIENNFLQIAIKDSGLGIPESRIKDIFSPFERLDANKTTVDGLGLGLTLTKMLVERMGGNINVSSELKLGTTFYIDLPLATAISNIEADSGLYLEKMIDNDINQYNILYIEDNYQNFNLIKRVLAVNENINLSHADTGENGIEFANKDRPDLILLDMRLPDIGGKEVYTQIKKNRLLQDVPVIVLSANANDDDIKDMLVMGVYDYLTKPVDIPYFISVINELIKLKENRKLYTQA